ncbi:DUF1830 domain-containing protein [Synechococcus sp. GFB01]|uniref:DUF1830 domain-containing protein n=1 Tax=Synechococcus sp. GFB01 TaxID=1662190 RepID=UPI0009080237|nr:DUF1830 domain-containing protein [Synechococcus sp. GFB01]
MTDRIGGEASDRETAAYGYRNGTNSMVVLRCCGPDQFCLERVVFPFEMVTFLAPLESEVRIYGPTAHGMELIKEVALEELRLETLGEPLHRLEQGTLRARLHDLEERYAREPSEENRQRLVGHTRLMQRWLPGLA